VTRGRAAEAAVSRGCTLRKPTAMRFQALMVVISRVSSTMASGVKCGASAS
jgi:phage portal protein BeeE